MDTLTHGLMGAVISQMGFRQRIGRDAAWVAALSAMSPDLDIFVRPILMWTGAVADGSSLGSIHRSWTHSLLMAPLMAMALALAWAWLRRTLRRRERPDAPHATTAAGPPSFWLLYACVLAAVVSHDMLDLFTSYGTQLLLPLSHAKYAIDALPIVDLVLSSLLILTLVACFVVRKVRARPSPLATRAIGRTGFVLACAYICAALQMHESAIRQLEALAGGQPLTSARAYPALGSIFLWRGVAQTPDRWIVARIRPLGASPTAAKVQQYPDVRDEWTDRARQLPEFRAFETFARGHVRATSQTLDGRHVVEFSDMRYSQPGSAKAMWSLQVVFDPDGQVLSARQFSDMPRTDFLQRVRESWDDMWR